MNKVLIENSLDYWVTDTGRVFRGKRELKKNKGTVGYTTVSIAYINGPRKLKFVHRLVAEAFISNPENKPIVNHKNLVKKDNRIENLEWVTAQENCRHAHDNGAHRVDNAATYSMYPIELIHKICSLIQEGRRTIDIIKALAVPKHLVHDIRTKRIWNHISDLYVFVKARTRRLSDQTAEWICKMIVEGKTPKEIKELSSGKVNTHTVKDIKQKKSYADISGKYF
jgi:hypothetical protein